MILSIVSLKGGVAKTTTAMLLAMCAAEDGLGVTLVDADPELSAVAWAMQAKTLPFQVIRGDQDGLVRQAKDLHEAGQTVIIDTPPNSKDVLISAALAAHIAIVPVSPTAIDINRMARTLKALLDVEAVRPDLDVQILLTRLSRGTKLARTTADMLQEYPVLPAFVRDLERYKAMGGTVPGYLAEYREVWGALQRLRSG